VIEDESAYNFLYGFISLVPGLNSVHCKLEYSWAVYKSYDIRGCWIGISLLITSKDIHSQNCYIRI